MALQPVTTFDEACQKIEGITDRLGKSIDPKIKLLVASLNMWGIETKASCQGHKDRKPGHPWIDIQYPHIERAGKLLCVPNIKLQLGWCFVPYASWLRWQPSDLSKPLCVLQGQCNILADYLINYE